MESTREPSQPSRVTAVAARAGAERAPRAQSLQRLGAVRGAQLARLGLGTLRELLDYEPLRSARVLAAAARGLIDPGLEPLVTAEYAGGDAGGALGWPVGALHGVGAEAAKTLAAIGVKTIGDLAQLGKEADQAVLDAHQDNGFSERPSAPSELLPSPVGSVTTSSRYASFVRDKEIRSLRLSVDADCLVPLPISGFLVKDPSARRPPSLADIFTAQTCPVIHLGYMCDHRHTWINLGTHLGEVVHSVSLAPGESRNIALVNWRRRQLTALEEHTTTSERLTATFVQNRALEEVTGAVAREHQSGRTQTEANTAVTAAGLAGAGAVVGGVALGATGAIIGTVVEPGAGTAIGAAVGAAVGAAAGVAAGGLVFAGSQALGMIEAASEGDRDVVADVQQRISLSTSQNASAVRSLWSTVVVEDAQAEAVDVRTSNITNYNHMHALNIEYYEVLQHYLARLDVVGVRPIVLLPFAFFDFTSFKYVRDYWDAVRGHVGDEQLRAQGDAYFIQEAVPSAPDLLPVPPLPTPPGAAAALTLTDLQIDLIFKAADGLGGTVLNFVSDVDLEVMKGSESVLPVPPEGTALSGLDADEKGKRFMFPTIADAQLVSKVRLERSQLVNTDVRYRIRVYKGKLTQGSATVDDLAGENIATNATIKADSSDLTFDRSWTPAAAALAATQEALQAFNHLVAEHNAVIAENEQRQAAFEALVQDMTRFEQRLQRLVARRRNFFTRVILDAIEPEEITRILESLRVVGAGARTAGIPLSTIAHTVPLGTTAGAFVLRLKRLDRRAVERMFAGVRTVSRDLVDLCRYADATQAHFAEPDVQRALTRADHVYLPTGGLFAEAILGRANGAEFLDMERYFNWKDSPIPHQPPAIDAVSAASRAQQQEINVHTPTGTINVMSPAALPDPTGLTGVLAAVQNANLFRDMSKATELAGIVGNLTTLAGQMGQAASTMTGQAAQQALQAATQIGQTAATLAQAMMSEALQQAGTAFATLTEQGAALNEAARLDQARDGGASVPGGAGQPGAGSGQDHGASGSDSGGNGFFGSGGDTLVATAPAPSLQEETFRQLTGTGGHGVTLANFTPDGGGGSGTAPAAGGSAAPASVAAAIAAAFPGLDPAIAMPSPRNCCALFPGGVMGFFRTRYLDPGDVAGHRYGESGFFPDDSVGHVYTARGGFVDLGHVRDLADMARFIASRAMIGQSSGVEQALSAEAGARRVRIVAAPALFPNVELAVLIGARAAYELAIWHEIVTWFTPIRHSAFSPEDNYSNLLGALVGASAAGTRGQAYDDGVDQRLTAVLRSLGARAGDVAEQAVAAVTGLWFERDNDLTSALAGAAEGNRILLRRHIAPAPEVMPWLVTDLHGRTFTEADPIAGPGTDRTIAFDLGSPRPTPLALFVPHVTSSGHRLSDFYELSIDVDSQVVPTRVLPAGRTRITGADLPAIVASVKQEILADFPGGDLPIDP
jgi:hypothetical protein